jgi:hypothetical protein
LAAETAKQLKIVSMLRPHERPRESIRRFPDSTNLPALCIYPKFGACHLFPLWGFPEKEGFLAEPLMMAFARGGGGDRRRQGGRSKWSYSDKSRNRYGFLRRMAQLDLFLCSAVIWCTDPEHHRRASRYRKTSLINLIVVRCLSQEKTGCRGRSKVGKACRDSRWLSGVSGKWTVFQSLIPKSLSFSSTRYRCPKPALPPAGPACQVPAPPKPRPPKRHCPSPATR